MFPSKYQKRICGGCGIKITESQPADVFVPGVGAIRICNGCFDAVKKVLPLLLTTIDEEAKEMRKNWSDFGQSFYQPPKQKLSLKHRPAKESK